MMPSEKIKYADGFLGSFGGQADNIKEGLAGYA